MNLMSVLDCLGKDTVLMQIFQAEIYEYGMVNEPLAQKIGRVLEAHRPGDGKLCVAGALNNHDFSGILLEPVRREPKEMLVGLGVIAWLADAGEILVYLPENEIELAETLKTCAAEMELKVEVVLGLADARKLREGLVCHFETLMAVANLLGGCYKPGSYLRVVTFETSEKVVETAALAFVPFDTKAADLIGDLSGVKAVGIGPDLYLPSEIEDLYITRDLALGDGEIRVYSKDCCMVDAACRALLESRKKSCGKCTFCREGLLQLHTRIKDAVNGKGEAESPQIMQEIGEAMRFSCCCSLGEFGSCFTLSVLERFADEVEDHIKRKKCTADTCLAFVNMYIDPVRCTGCGKCRSACCDDLIEGLDGYIHMIEDLDCRKCGKCMEVCEEKAIVRTTNRIPRIPDRLTRVGRFRRY